MGKDRYHQHEDLSAIPGTHIVGEKKTATNSLTSPVYPGMWTHTRKQTQTKNFLLKNITFLDFLFYAS